MKVVRSSLLLAIIVGASILLVPVPVGLGQTPLCTPTGGGGSAGSETCTGTAAFTVTLTDVVAIDVTNSLTTSTAIIRSALNDRYLPITGTFVVNIFAVTNYAVTVQNALTSGTIIGTGDKDKAVEMGDLVVSNADDAGDNANITGSISNCALVDIGASTGTCQDITTASATSLFTGGNTSGGSSTFQTVTGRVRVDKDALGDTSTDTAGTAQSFTFTLTFTVTET